MMRAAVTILLVEDDKSMLDGMSDLLQVVDIGYEVEVLTASNGREALDIMYQHSPTPDLIVSDIMMPEMDGFQFLAEVHKKLEWSNIPFIFLTAKGDKHEIHKGRVSGADLYVTKPFQSSDLLELIRAQLDRALLRKKTHERSINSLKKDILQIINHEFRTPLTYVTAYYELLKDSFNQFTDYEDFQSHLHGIQAGCVRLTRLVDDFIQVMQLRTNEAQQIHQQRATLISNFGDVIQEALQTVQKQAQQQGIQLHYEAALDFPVIFGDRANLVNLFSRLLDNAVKFATRIPKKSPGNVYISTHIVNQELHISIEDDGIGFQKHLRNRIFDLFFQYNRSTREQQGAGIGLTIVKGMVELHNGRIEVDSEENVGSTFTVILPIYAGETAPELMREPDHIRKTAHILIVEDDPHLMEGLQELLEIYQGKYHLKILTAPNGVDGLNMLTQYPADLIISDIMMPQMDGHEFLQKVRENPAWIQIPFVFLTAKSDKRDEYDGFRRGAEEFIAKPYDSDQLLELVVKQLDRRFRAQILMARDFEEIQRSILRIMNMNFHVPLSKVNEYSYRLAEQLENQTQEKFMESLREIQDGSTRLSKLVEDFIALAELKTGEASITYSLRAEPIYDIGVILYEIGQTYAFKGIPVLCPLNVDLPPVYGYGKYLTNAICRLIDMSVEYAPEPGSGHKTLSLLASCTDEEVSLSIALNTTFNDETTQEVSALLNDPEITEQQTDAPDLKSPGLNIIKGYIHLHNGRITLTNDITPGLAFIITLPIYVPTG